MKKEINLITFNIDNINKNHHKKINYKDYYYIGPWCEGNPFYLKKLKQKKILNLYDPKSVKKKTKDVQYIESIYEKYAPYFAKNLNIIHKRKYGKKFWKLFLDRWLRAYIADVYSKWKLVEVLLQKHVIKKFPILEMSEEHFIPQNTWHHNTIIKSQDTLFSHFVLSKVLIYKQKNLNKFYIKPKIIFKQFNDYKHKFLNYKNNFNISFKKKIFSYDVQVDPKILLKLNIDNLFFNIPLFKKSEKIKNDKIDTNLRKNFSLLFQSKKRGFEDFLIKQIYYSIPKTYLEHFNQIEDIYKKLNWPESPSYILTTFGHFYNEIFKMYCAHKMSNKSKLYIFQHGYAGFYDDNDYYSIGWDYKVSNKIFAWGKYPGKKLEPFYYTKKFFSKRSIFRQKEINKILIINYGFNEQPYRPPHGFNDNTENNKTITYDTISFLKKIKIKSKSKVDLKILDHSKSRCVEKYLKKKMNWINVYNEKKPLLEFLKNHNLVIHFFLGTPFFETMLVNKPTILIYNSNLDMNYDKNFNAVLKKLEKKNIVFKNIYDASKFVNKNYDDLENWWNHYKTQDLVKEFCENYCRNFNDSLNFKKYFK